MRRHPIHVEGRARLFACLLPLAFAACGDDGGPAGPPDGGGDGGADAAVLDPDASIEPDAGDGCLPGQHLCGTSCVEDLPDEPLNGCRLGCGDPCPAPDGGHATCSLAGRCDFVCDAPWVRDGAECRCEPATCATLGAMCGSVDDGCGGTLECGGCEGGAECTDGACGCPPDAGEPNEVRSEATVLSPLTDRPDSSLTATEYSLGSAGDEDWFRSMITDGTDGGNPQITVTLSDIPAGSDYDLAIFYLCSGAASVCTAGDPVTVMDGCGSSNPGDADETAGLSAECSGIDDSGLLLVQVTSSTWGGSCAPYRLHVDVH